MAILDEIADTGETLALVATRTLERGASQIKTAALAAHTWADPQPHFAALVSDALIVFPWDRRFLIDGQWRVHPEIEEALKSQKFPPEEDLTSG